MKVSKLKKHLSPFRKIITSDPLVYVLRNLLISGSKITGSDLRNYLTVDVGEQLTGKDFLIDCKILLKILRYAKDSYEVSFEVGENITVKVGDYTFHLESEPVDDFIKLPTVTTPSKDKLLDIDLITRACDFTSNDELRPAMQCVSIDKNIAATDGHRLFFVKSKNKANLLLRVDSARLLDKLFTTPNITYNDFWVKLEENGVVLISKVVEERFPDWKAVVPEKFSFSLTIDNDIFREAIEMTKITAGIYIALTVFPDKVWVKADDKNFGCDSFVSVPAESDVKEKYTIGFNPDFLLSMLEGKKSTIQFQGENNKGVIIDGKYLLMPVMIHEAEKWS